MKLALSIAKNKYLVDTEEVYSLSIPLKFNGDQPNHFGAEKATNKSMKSQDFIGSTTRGGSCNVDIITMNPHCNGTHTETIHHIVDENINIGRLLNNSLAPSQLVSITPKLSSETTDTYKPQLNDTDLVIDLESLKNVLDLDVFLHVEALIIRTLPNDKSKYSRIYSTENQPPFFTKQAIKWLSKSRIKHLLVDFPSIDRMFDEGRLTNHRYYWNVKPKQQKLDVDSKTDRTVTEMIYVKNHIEDGLYLLNLQYPSFELDAAPSRPLLYPLKKITSKS